MIVVDSNVIAYLTYPGPFTEEVMSVHEKDPDWIAPMLWRSEFLNVTSVYLRRGLIKYDDALETIEKVSILMKNKEYSLSPYSILETINQSSCSAYDCEFVALAKEQNLFLITYDQKIRNEFPDVAISAKDFLDKYKK